MEKFCVFCGEKPVLKNREHVIPQWLINLTGDPNREVYLGRKWTSPNFEERRFSFNSFTFPACTRCNEGFSYLEAEAKTVAEKIFSHSALTAYHWDTLLDWLDKIRTGIWLGMIYLNNNYLDIDPMFHIARRIGSKDRFVIVYEIIDDGGNGITWAGTESPLFEYMPSCFSLMINNFLFLNTSCDFLFSERFGFPFASTRKFRQEGGYWIEMHKGTGSLKFPLIDMKFKTGGSQIFQPIIPYGHFWNEDGQQAESKEIYDDIYVRNNCMDFSKGKGKIFIRDRNRLVEYPTTPNTNWIPKQKFRRGEIFFQTGIIVGQLLERLFCDYPSLDLLDDSDRCELEAELDIALRTHKAMMDQLINQKYKYV